MYRLIATVLCLSLLLPAAAHAQDRPNFGVRLLEGELAPFSGLLIDADAAGQCIEDAAAVETFRVELAVAQRVLQQSSTLYEQHINEQESRILQLSTTSWWEQNGNIIMLTLGLILGVVGAAVVVGLAN
jgi:hypothetical protein